MPNNIQVDPDSLNGAGAGAGTAMNIGARQGHSLGEDDETEAGQRLLTPLELELADSLSSTSSSSTSPLPIGQGLGAEEELEVTGKYVHSLPQVTEHKLGLGIDTWSRLFVLMGASFDFSWTSKQTLVSIMLIGVAVGTNFTQQLFVETPRMFNKAITDKDESMFLHALTLASLYISILFIGNGTFKLLAGCVKAWTRKSLTHRIHAKYLKDQLFYKAIVIEKLIDNPDERVVRDIDNFTQNTFSVLDKGTNCLLLIAFMTSVNYGTLGYTAFVPTVILIVAAVLSILFVRRVVPRVFRQQYLEGDFRYSHMCIRDGAESLAFLGKEAEEHERRFVDGAVARVVRNRISVILGYYPVDLINELLKYGGRVLGFVAVGVPYFFSDAYRDLSVSDILTAVFATDTLMSNLSSIVSIFEIMGDVAGYTARVGEIWELEERLAAAAKHDEDDHGDGTSRKKLRHAYKQKHAYAPPPLTGTDNSTGTGTTGTSTSTVAGKPVYALHNVSVVTPSGRTLISSPGITLTANEDQNVLIRGPNGSGKSSLLRVLCGLWPAHSDAEAEADGRGQRLEESVPGSLFSVPPNVYFAPQVPFIGQAVGTSLRDIITYPDVALPPFVSEDAIISKILDDLGAGIGATGGGLLGGHESLDAQHDWSKVLSPGEVQMLVFARILYHGYRFVVLDEPTASMSAEAEDCAFAALKAHGVHVISVGHSDRLLRHHSLALTLDGAGGWKVSAL